VRMISLFSDCSSCRSKSSYTVRVVFSRFGDGTTECSSLEAEGELPCLMIVLAVARNGVSLS
jgi:hypothetical protein